MLLISIFIIINFIFFNNLYGIFYSNNTNSFSANLMLHRQGDKSFGKLKKRCHFKFIKNKNLFITKLV